MDNRRALVTGGASGFGLETARALLAQGAQVAVADINADALHAAALDGALPLEIDVTSSASVASPPPARRPPGPAPRRWKPSAASTP